MTDDPRIGTQLGPYRIDRVIGRGGMGIVYLAEHVHLERPVALKVLSEHLANDASFRERFVRESRMAARLHHPNIIPVHDAGEQDGVLFIAMHYVDGEDLAALLDRGALPPGRALPILDKVASALDEAHANGILHRDVKPGNIVLGKERAGHEQEVYLTDFGLVREIDRRSRLTQSGYFVGTLDYAAPEMFQNTPIDGRADQYSLACVLYQCLTGEVPFPRDSEGALIAAHLMDPPPHVAEKRPALSGELDAAVARGMAKTPGERFASCVELVESARTAAAADAARGATIAAAPPLAAPEGAAPPPMTPPPAPVPGLAGAGAVGSDASGTSGAGPPVPPAPPRPGRGKRTAWLIGVGVVLIAAPIVVLLALTSKTASHPIPTGAPGTTGGIASPSASSSSSSGPATIAATIPVRFAPEVAAVGEGAVWVTNSGDDTVTRIDLDTNEATDLIAVGAGPIGVVVNAGLVAVVNANEDTVSVIDADTNTVVRDITVDSNPQCIAVGQGGAWVTNHSGSVSRLGRGTNAVKATIPVGAGTIGIAVGEGAVWAANNDDNTVSRIDPATNEVAATIDVGGRPVGVAVGAGAVWVTESDDDTVARIDPATNEVTAHVPVRDGPLGIAFGAGSVWVANSADGTVSRIDPASNTVVETVKVGLDPHGVTFGGGSVWVAVNDENSVIRIDP